MGLAVLDPVGEVVEEGDGGAALADMTRSKTWMSPLLVLWLLVSSNPRDRPWKKLAYRTLGLTTFASLNQISSPLIVTLTVTLAYEVNS